MSAMTGAKSSSQLAYEEHQRGLDFFAQRGHTQFTDRAQCTHMLSEVHFTGMGACLRSTRPHAKTSPDGNYLPSVIAAGAENPAKMCKSLLKASVSEPSLGSSARPRRPASQASEGGARSDVAAVGAPPARKSRRDEGPTRWPCSATFERPPTGLSNAAVILRKEQCLRTASRVVGDHEKAQPSGKTPEERLAAIKGEVDGRYVNPFMNRFYNRRPTGGYFAGSMVAAPKLTEDCARW
mmetsp:Transcript_14354/g.32654  ORF Transcript_14354/g.32654 Transcript_14354/m.32654 type:complete len:238 (-) Transcript_14354:106-819(-)